MFKVICLPYCRCHVQALQAVLLCISNSLYKIRLATVVFFSEILSLGDIGTLGRIGLQNERKHLCDWWVRHNEFSQTKSINQTV